MDNVETSASTFKKTCWSALLTLLFDGDNTAAEEEDDDSEGVPLAIMLVFGFFSKEELHLYIFLPSISQSANQNK